MVHILRKIIITCCLSISIVIYVYMSVSVQREYVTSHVKIGTNYKSLFTDKNSVQHPSARGWGEQWDLEHLVSPGPVPKTSQVLE